MNFGTWLKKEEGFTKAQYNLLLKTLPYERRLIINEYYKAKYKYYAENKPKQLEFEIK